MMCMRGREVPSLGRDLKSRTDMKKSANTLSDLLLRSAPKPILAIRQGGCRKGTKDRRPAYRLASVSAYRGGDLVKGGCLIICQEDGNRTGRIALIRFIHGRLWYGIPYMG